jgi:hypothetical protein
VGTDYTPPPFIQIHSAAFAIVNPPVGGLITYQVFDAGHFAVATVAIGAYLVTSAQTATTTAAMGFVF